MFGRSGKVLRRVVGMPDTTHVVTDEVLRAVARRDPKAIVVAINDERLAFLKRLKTWPVFGQGWGARVGGVRGVSLRMVGETVPSLSIVPSDAPVPGKGAVPAPTGTTKVIVGSGTAGPVAAGGSFWDWVAVHPYETAAMSSRWWGARTSRNWVRPTSLTGAPETSASSSSSTT